MPPTVLPLLLTLTMQAPATPEPTETELRRARQMVKGTWEIRSIVENGETLGPGLIKAKVAADGRLVIGDRMVEIHSPDREETRVSAYRLNPAAEPRRLDLITETDKLLKGIYRFDDDELIVCLQHKETGARPDGFEAPAGSDRVLMRLHLVSDTVATEPRAIERPPVSVRLDEELFPARPSDTPTPAQLSSARTIPASRTVVASDTAAPAAPSRALNETELRRAHQMLYGTWRVVSLERNGENIGAGLFREKIARDGQVTIGNRVLTLVSPQSGEKRISSYRLDPSRDPRRIDVITEFDDVKKGIYKFEGDELWICLNENLTENARPTDFDASSGTDNMLFKLRLVEPASLARPEPRPTAATVATPAPTPAPAPQPSAAELARRKEEQIRQMLVGSWTRTDPKGTLTLVVQPDGAFIATRSWARATKRLLAGQTTTSSGRWSYAKGWFRADVTTSEDFLMAGRTYYSRIETIGDTSVVAEDVLGKLVTYRKLR